MAEYSLSPKEASALSCSEIPNSSDSISRQDAIDALDRIFDNVPMELTTEILRLRRELRGLPSADVVQVVRCRDCKYNANPPEVGNADCDLFYGMTEQYGFCHRAERRTDG